MRHGLFYVPWEGEMIYPLCMLRWILLIHLVSGTEILNRDAYLGGHRQYFSDRMAAVKARISHAEKYFGSFDNFTQGYKRYGFNRTVQVTHRTSEPLYMASASYILHVEQDGKPGIVFQEWAPNAKYADLVGDFNNWTRGTHSLIKDPKTVRHQQGLMAVCALLSLHPHRGYFASSSRIMKTGPALSLTRGRANILEILAAVTHISLLHQRRKAISLLPRQHDSLSFT